MHYTLIERSHFRKQPRKMQWGEKSNKGKNNNETPCNTVEMHSFRVAISITVSI